MPCRLLLGIVLITGAFLSGSVDKARGQTYALASGIPALEDIAMVSVKQGWGTTPQSVWWTIDGGHTWHDVTPRAVRGLGIGAYAFIDALTAWVAALTPSGTAFIFRTVNGGKTWESSRLRLVGSAGGPEFLPASGRRSSLVVYDTVDAGGHWTFMPPLNLHANIASAPVDFVDALHGWIVIGHRLYATHNSARTWAAVASNRRFSAGDHLDFVTDRIGFALTAPGRASNARMLLTTVDGGHSWNTLSYEYLNA
jgi:photosystem II stability/assembly factor-like uncharacterized protein